MKKILLISVILLFFMSSIGYTETRTIKATVDSLPNESDLADNKIEKEVTIVEQGYNDLGILDITVSPAYVVIGSSINFSVGVKNYGC